MLCFFVGVFFGALAGGMLFVWQATRPYGYRANNGKRYKLTELT